MGFILLSSCSCTGLADPRLVGSQHRELSWLKANIMGKK